MLGGAQWNLLTHRSCFNFVLKHLLCYSITSARLSVCPRSPCQNTRVRFHLFSFVGMVYTVQHCSHSQEHVVTLARFILHMCLKELKTCWGHTGWACFSISTSWGLSGLVSIDYIQHVCQLQSSLNVISCLWVGFHVTFEAFNLWEDHFWTVQKRKQAVWSQQFPSLMADCHFLLLHPKFLKFSFKTTKLWPLSLPKVTSHR